MATNLGANVTGSTVALTWSAAGPLGVSDPGCDPFEEAATRITHEVYRRPSGGSYSLIATLDGFANSYNNTGVAQGSYDYYIRYVDEWYEDIGLSSCMQHTQAAVSNTASATVGATVTPFTFPAQTGLEPNVTANSATRTISISPTSDTVTITLSSYTYGAQWRKQVGGTWQAWQSSAGTVAHGNGMQVRMTTSSVWGENRYVTLHTGSYSTGFSITTRPDAGGLVTLPASGEISFNMLRNVLGPPQATNVHLGEYLRGGAYVVDNAANAHVPTALPISITALYNAQSEWRLNTVPSTVGDSLYSVATFTPSKTASTKQDIEYRWVSISTEDATFSGSAMNNWSTNGTMTLTYDENGLSEFGSGSATLEARIVSGPTVTVRTVLFLVGDP